MDKPKISIITPVRNNSTALEKAIRSVAGQTYRNIEHVIIDGASEDGTLTLVQRLQKKFKHVVLFSEPDTGVYNAMNKGLNNITGDWIYFLGADDLLHDQHVFTRLFDQGVFEKEQIVYGNVIIEGDTFWAKDAAVYDGPFDLEKLFKRNLCHQSVFYPRSVIENMGYYNEKYEITADWDYNIRCFAKYPFQYVDLIIANFRTGGKSSLGGDHSLYEDLPENVIRYFNLNPDEEQYYNFNNPFYYPVSRYREEKKLQKIRELGKEISQLIEKMNGIRSEQAKAEHALRESHEKTLSALRTEHAAKEKALMTEFTGSLAPILTGHIDAISRLEEEHARQLEAQRRHHDEITTRLEQELDSLRKDLSQKVIEFRDSLHQKDKEYRDSLQQKEREHNDLVNRKDKELAEYMHRRELEFATLLNQKENENRDYQHRKELEFNHLLNRKEKEFFDQLHQKETAFRENMNRREKEFAEQAAYFKENTEKLLRIINQRDEQISSMTTRHGEEIAQLQGLVAKRDEVINILYKSYRYRVGNFLVSPFSKIYRKFKPEANTARSTKN